MGAEARERRIRAFGRVLPWSNEARPLAGMRVQEVGVGVLRISRPWTVGVKVFHLAGLARSVELVMG